MICKSNNTLLRIVESLFLLVLMMTLAAFGKSEDIDAPLLAKANAGDPAAEFLVGVRYANGIGVSKDYEQAVVWFRKAAEQGFAKAQKELHKAANQGNVNAQKALGYLYSNGKGVTQDYVQAVAWFRKAAEQGSAEAREELQGAANQGNINAQLALGYLYSNGKGVTQDYVQAVAWFRRAAALGSAEAREELRREGNQGNINAQLALGYLYSNGNGVTQDYVQAVDWFRRAAALGSAEAREELQGAANEGNIDAQLALGYLYSNGKGVTQDYAQAVDWFRRAAELGSSEAREGLSTIADRGNINAQLVLSDLYSNGLGVTQDYGQAAIWFRKAADQGDVNSQAELGYLYSNGKGVAQDYSGAAIWFRKAADQGDVNSQVELGYLYSNGLGVTQDYAQAAIWFRKAADQGLAKAQQELAGMYRDGRGVPQDYAVARGLYVDAARQGEVRSQFDLAVMNHLGQGISPDDLETVAWWKRAAEQDDADAQAYLGFVYLTGGACVPQDYAQAYFWLDLAASGELVIFRQEDVERARDDSASHLTSEVLFQTQKRAVAWSKDHSIHANRATK